MLIPKISAASFRVISFSKAYIAPNLPPFFYEIVDRIQRLVLQCSHREQELLLALIDKMLDTRGKPEKE